MFLKRLLFKKEGDLDRNQMVEQKMHLSQTNPEPVFDLSECGLTSLPNGVYSMCKVFQKDTLLLNDNRFDAIPNNEFNRLIDLKNLRRLDISNNRLLKVTSKLDALSNLEDLNLSGNKLKRLPDNLSNLRRLKHVHLRSNNLLEFPDVLTKLSSLMSIDIRENDRITKLNPGIINLRKLVKLKCDAYNMEFPSPTTFNGGLQSVICAIKGSLSPEELETITVAYDEGSIDVCDVKQSPDSDDEDNSHKVIFNKYLLKKEEKKKLWIECEKQLQFDNEMEKKLSIATVWKKQEILNELYKEQFQMDQMLTNILMKKLQSKTELLEAISLLENHSKSLVKSLSKWDEKRNQRKQILQQLERDSKQQDSRVIFRKAEVISAMQHKLADEINEGQLQDFRLKSLMKNKEANQELIRERLLKEESLQKRAFERLQQERDEQHRTISNQIQLIERELIALTRAEMQRKILNCENIMTDLGEQRCCLAFLLAQLLEEKSLREIALKRAVDELEERRDGVHQDSENFWFVEYQRLLNESEPNINNISDENVRKALILSGDVVTPHLHIFLERDLTFEKLCQTSEKDLCQFGIEYEVAQVIVESIDQVRKFLPTAPEESGDSPTAEAPKASAPPIEKFWFQIECVICLESESNIIFLPCGHVCCCIACSKGNVGLCPLCRAEISQKELFALK